MRIGRGILVVSTLALLLLPGLVGCAAGNSSPQTVVVTQTVIGTDSASTGTAATDGVTAGALSTASDTGSGATDTAATGTESPTSAESTSISAAPIVTVDPLKSNCAKVLNNTKITTELGPGIPTTENRVVDVANSARNMTGRLKCQYGISADKSTIAVSVLLAQYSSEATAQAQIGMTVSSETGLGAKASTTSIQGHPAQVLLRDGGLLVVGYDSWTLSVVIAANVTSDDKLPAALAAIADYSLTKVIS